MKVMTVVGTRPEIIKLSRVIPCLDDAVHHVLVHTGQNYDYELNEIFFRELELRSPDHVLDVAGATLAETIGNVIARTDAVMEAERPDALLVLGDTNSALCVLSAKRRRIPVFHMEAGNRCFDDRVPEEINRRVVDHLSDINLPYTEHARRYLLDEGLKPDTVIKTGSPQKEVLTYHRDRIDRSDVTERLGVEAGRYFVVSLHREENVDAPARLANLVASINRLVVEHDMPAILSLHPRTRVRLEAAGHELHPLVRAMAPLGLPDYVHLQQHGYCTISDSGTITEESSILGFPAVTVREAHERPEGMDVGVLIMSGGGPDELVRAVRTARAHFEAVGPPTLPPDYDADDVSWKVTKIILSYTDFVNRRVWSVPPA